MVVAWLKGADWNLGKDWQFSMLPKRNRLSGEAVFKKIYQKGQIIHGRWFSLKWLENRQGYPRFGIVISKKAAALATARNLLKRKISAKIVSLLKKDEVRGLDVIILIRPIQKDQFNAASEAILEQLKKLLYSTI